MSPREAKAPHGTRACYVRGCRRRQCVEANRAYHEQRRRAAGMAPARRGPGPHGTVARYKSGCHCARCRTANTAYYRERRQAG